MKAVPIIIVDTREQKPYRFDQFEVTVKALATGDYSLAGLENQVAIERKTKNDAYSSIGRARARFERELERLARLRYAAIVIEASLTDFLQAPRFSGMNSRPVACGPCAR